MIAKSHCPNCKERKEKEEKLLTKTSAGNDKHTNLSSWRVNFKLANHKKDNDQSEVQ